MEVYLSERTNRMAAHQLCLACRNEEGKLTRKEVGFSTSVPSDNDIMTRGEGLYLNFVSVRLEARDGNGLDVLS